MSAPAGAARWINYAATTASRGAAYIRHHGANSSEVEDLAQAFFLHFLERDLHVRADPLRGSFRPFLLTALRNFLRSEVATAAAAKTRPHTDRARR